VNKAFGFGICKVSEVSLISLYFNVLACEQKRLIILI